MNRRQFLATLAASSVALGGAARVGANQVTPRAEAFLSQMTLRQKVGQMFLFSLSGRDFTPDMLTLIRDAHAGGMALFSYNVGTPEQVTSLTNEMQRAALGAGLPVPLFIAADQEGGRILRLQSAPFSAFPSAMALGAADDLSLTEQIGAAIAEEMAACGLNMNLAPVLDVNSQAFNPVIDVRAFGADPAKVAAHGAAFVRGSHAVGVVATGKHFPGHGSTVDDSHYTLPIVELGYERLLAEMEPFQTSIGAEIGAMMTAHVLYQALDDSPATFSNKILTDLLRTQMGFGGVLMTDALTMGAVSEARDNPIYVLRDAILAGVDMLAFGAFPNGAEPSLNAQIDMLEMVVALVESGLMDETRVDDSVRRILSLKDRFGLLDWQALPPESTRERLLGAEHFSLLTDVAERSITLQKDEARQLPLDPSQPIAILYPAEFPLVGDGLAFDWADVVKVAYPVNPNVSAMGDVTEQLDGRQVIMVTVDMNRNAGQIDLVNQLPLDRLILVAMRSPYDILNVPLVQTYLCTYGYTPHAILALRAVLLGDIRPSGVAPVPLV